MIYFLNVVEFFFAEHSHEWRQGKAEGLADPNRSVTFKFEMRPIRQGRCQRT